MSSKVTASEQRKQVAKSSSNKSVKVNKKKKIEINFQSPKGAGANSDLQSDKQKADLAIYINGLFSDYVKKLGISSYDPVKITQSNFAKLAQSNLYNIIRCFEGNPANNYGPYIGSYKENGNKTTGFGKVSKNPITSEKKAYELMCKDLENFNKILHNKIGTNYDKLPNSIKEGLLDLAYNKGPAVITGNKDLISAIQNSDYSTIVANLLYQYSIHDTNKEHPEPGLYRRSFCRAAMACRDLQGKELKESVIEVENIYKEAENCFNYNINKLDENIKKEKNKKQRLLKAFEDLKSEHNIFITEYAEVLGTVQHEKDAKEAARKGSIAQAEPTKIDTQNGVKTEEQKENEDGKPGFLAKAVAASVVAVNVLMNPGAYVGRALANGTKSLINHVKNWFSSEDKEYTFDENASVMSNMLNDKTVKQEEDGDFQIITVDYEVKKGNNLFRLGIRYGITDDIIANNNDIEDKNLIQEGQIIKIQKIGYKVKKDDTVESIAEKYGVSVDVIKDINNIDEENPIKKNQIIEIPGLLYKTKKDGTLDKIAEKAGISVEKLMEINGLKENKVKAGDVLKVVTSKPVFSVPSNFGDIKDYPLLMIDNQRKDANGKILAMRKVFEPTHNGPLSGKTIIVNAGHGYKKSARIDCGADYSSNNIPDEWIVNHRNALELTSRLQAQGAKVIFMQGFRSLVVDEFSKKENKADLFISLHANAAGKNAKDRTQFYCYEKVNDKNNKQKSIKLSQMAEQKFNSWIPQNEQIEEKDKFYSNKKAVYAESKITNKRVGILNCAINKLHSPAMLWEVGFGTSKKGAERLNDEELMENYMKLMTETIVEYFQGKDVETPPMKNDKDLPLTLH